MADLSVLKLPNNSTYNIKDASSVASVTESNRTVTVTKRNGTSSTFSTAYADATSSAAGLMSATDKARLDELFEKYLSQTTFLITKGSGDYIVTKSNSGS